MTVSAPTHALALARAITLGVDAGLAQVVCPGTHAARRARQHLPDALAHVTRIVHGDPDAHTLTVDVLLPAGAPERALLGSRPALARLRCLVLIPEDAPLSSLPAPITERLLMAALHRAGLRLRILPPRVQLRERAWLRAGLSAPVYALRLRRLYRCDLLFTGLATMNAERADAHGSVGHARLELRVLTLPAGVVLHSETLHGTGWAHSDVAAGRLALADAGRCAGQTLPGAALRAVQGQSGEPRRYVLHLVPPVPFCHVSRLLACLPAGVTASLHSVTPQGTTVDLLYAGGAAGLAQALSGVLTVTGINGVNLAAALRITDPQPP